MRFVCTYMIDQETVRSLKVFICEVFVHWVRIIFTDMHLFR